MHVSPVTGLIAHPPPVSIGAPPASSPLPPATKPSIVSCDAGGCIMSDGTRLQRAGGLLLGPNGLCNAQAPGQRCP